MPDCAAFPPKIAGGSVHKAIWDGSRHRLVADTARMPDFSIAIEKSRHLSFPPLKGNVSLTMIHTLGRLIVLSAHAQKAERARFRHTSWWRARLSARVSHASLGRDERCDGKTRSLLFKAVVAPAACDKFFDFLCHHHIFRPRTLHPLFR